MPMCGAAEKPSSIHGRRIIHQAMAGHLNNMLPSGFRLPTWTNLGHSLQISTSVSSLDQSTESQRAGIELDRLLTWGFPGGHFNFY